MKTTDAYNLVFSDAFYMDLDIKVIEKTADGCLVIEYVPKPERYSIKEVNGVEGYWDKFDEIFIPFDVFDEAVQNIGNLPVFIERIQLRM